MLIARDRELPGQCGIVFSEAQVMFQYWSEKLSLSMEKVISRGVQVSSANSHIDSQRFGRNGLFWKIKK